MSEKQRSNPQYTAIQALKSGSAAVAPVGKRVEFLDLLINLKNYRLLQKPNPIPPQRR